MHGGKRRHLSRVGHHGPGGAGDAGSRDAVCSREIRQGCTHVVLVLRVQQCARTGTNHGSLRLHGRQAVSGHVLMVECDDITAGSERGHDVRVIMRAKPGVPNHEGCRLTWATGEHAEANAEGRRCLSRHARELAAADHADHRCSVSGIHRHSGHGVRCVGTADHPDKVAQRQFRATGSGRHRDQQERPGGRRLVSMIRRCRQRPSPPRHNHDLPAFPCAHGAPCRRTSPG